MLFQQPRDIPHLSHQRQQLEKRIGILSRKYDRLMDDMDRLKKDLERHDNERLVSEFRFVTRPIASK